MNTCKTCSKNFEITAADREFLNKTNIPDPTLCPTCRHKRRLAHWPYGILQKRKCDFSGENIICTFPPNARFPVYKRNHWFADEWTPPQQEIDWNRPFFDQLYELQCKTPHFHKLGKNNTNCDYADDVWESKNIYMSRSLAQCEDLMYIYRILKSKDSVDITYCYDLEQCYECAYCFKGYNLKFSLDCNDCSDSYFLYDCRGTRNSFMCWNLRNKEYHILNKPYSKEEYKEKIKSFKLNSRKSLEEFKQQFKEHIKNDAFHKPDNNVNSQNCTGNYITDCKNCHDAYFLEYAEDCNYVMRSPYSKTCLDSNGLYRGELCYEICQSTDLNNVQFAHYSMDCHDSRYIDQCISGGYLFGCVGLKRKEYCILNKQYSREEYGELVPKLIDHMKKHGEYGEFFPYRFAYNGYNLSLGTFYYPETEQSIKEKGGFFEEEPEIQGEGMDANTLPDLSEEITDDIIGKSIAGIKTKKTYSFIQQEIDFYRQHNLPLPAYYPEERNRQRFSQLVPMESRKAKCSACSKEITTYYPEEWNYKKILCEECYLKEVY